jgi:hypothetical protein
LNPEDIEEAKQEQLFDIIYECKFPQADTIDEKGFTNLLIESDLIFKEDYEITEFGTPTMGVDVAESGGNFNSIVIRWANIAKVIYRWQSDNIMDVCGRIIECKKTYQIEAENIFIDTIGVGKGVYDRLREQDIKVNESKGSEKPYDETQFINKRAENYFEMKNWIKRGGFLIKNDKWNELLDIKYKVKDSSGKMQIMSKDEMRKYGIESPDVADAFSMCFSRPEYILKRKLNKGITTHKRVVGIGFQK